MTAIDGQRSVGPLQDDLLLELLHDTATAVRTALDAVTDWGLAGTRAGQHLSDIAADDAALERLRRAGVGILSEESGPHETDRDIVVVVDPLDGSTNAFHGVPWYATSLCAVDGDGPLAAVVVNQASGTRFEAVRGGGARRDGAPIAPSNAVRLAESIVGISGYPGEHLGWRQFRAMGAAALDISAVAAGVLDAYVDCTPGHHGAWDYLGGLLICQEAGAVIADGKDEELVTLDWAARRMPIAAATPALLEEVLAARRRVNSDIPAKRG
ncbi:MAG: inositol monophosphatase [Actinobacteria bacterium]|nr:inositol monophosphatase [Actinomycetota bacterium]